MHVTLTLLHLQYAIKLVGDGILHDLFGNAGI